LRANDYSKPRGRSVGLVEQAKPSSAADRTDSGCWPADGPTGEVVTCSPGRGFGGAKFVTLEGQQAAVLDASPESGGVRSSGEEPGVAIRRPWKASSEARTDPKRREQGTLAVRRGSRRDRLSCWRGWMSINRSPRVRRWAARSPLACEAERPCARKFRRVRMSGRASIGPRGWLEVARRVESETSKTAAALRLVLPS